MGKMRIERRTFLKETTGMVAGLMAGAAFAADKKEAAGSKEAGGKEWTPLFNGKDLSGWKPLGGAVWTLENGCIVGKQGPNYTPGDLFTEQEFGDFELRVVCKIEWPANSGVWFRYQAPNKAYQADILEYKDPVAYSGTLYCPDKMFLAINKDAAIVKKDDWNTFVIKAQGDHLVITLNDKVTADVHEGSFAKGKIGFQVHPGKEFKDMKIAVREVVIKPLASGSDRT